MPGAPWIKLWTEVFDDQKIRIIHGMPEGAEIVLCWLRLLCLAGKCGMGGVVVVGDNIPYSTEMLSSVWNIPSSTVTLAIQTLEKLKMITIEDDDTILINNWSHYQSLKSYEEIKEQNRIRQQNKRDRDKQALLEDASRDESRYITVQEEEAEAEGERTKVSGKPDVIPYKAIVEYLNEKVGSNFRSESKQTRRMIKARWADGFRLLDFQQAIAWAEYKWSGDEKMVDFLRPQTLFSGKMESYIENFKREVADE